MPLEFRSDENMHDPARILIVDDNEANRDILATRLATQGYDLCQAVDGEEAIVAAVEERVGRRSIGFGADWERSRQNRNSL